MKTIIRKFWGVALVVMMLSSLFVVTAPAAAAAYAFTDAAALPTMAVAGLSILDVAQSGDVIYATATDGTGVDYLYKSVDAGATWSALLLGAGLPIVGASTWGLVAVAYDDPTIVAVVNTDVTAGVVNNVYLSVNGGISFSAISAFTATLVINSVDISPLDPATASHFVAVGGNTGAGVGFLQTWQTGLLVGAWTDPNNIFVDVPAGAPNTALSPVPTDVQAVKYSPNFGVDGALLFITEEPYVAGPPIVQATVTLHLYSYGYTDVDPLGFSFPRALTTGTGALDAQTSLKASIALDADFFLSDYEVGFIGAEIASVTSGQVGGVFRIDTGVPGLTRIQGSASGGATGLGINSVAWDGTNLMSAPYDTVADGALTIYRSANALTAGAAFAPSSPFKTPGTGTFPIVFWAGGDGYAVSQGKNAAVARTTDLGKSFNGVALFNSSLNTLADFWIKSDGSVIYALTDDGTVTTTDILLWKKTGTTWERVFTLANAATQPWIVRASQSDPNAVYLGRIGAKTMYKSLDGGEYIWTPRSCTQFIADFAVQSATTLYVASSTTGTVVKTTNGTTSWATVGALAGGTGYSITLLADNKIVVGGATGFVGYYDGTTWTAIPVALGTAPGNTVVTASDTATGGVIMAGNPSGIGTWTIGTSTALTGWAGDLTAPPIITGIAYVNGILYASADAVDAIYRYLYPTTVGVAAVGVNAPTDTINTGAVVVAAGANVINTLQATTGSSTLWARVSATPDALYSYTENVIGAGAAPSPTYPIDGAIIPVNSLNGLVNAFVLQWNSLLGTAFDIQVFQDEAMNISAGGTLVGTPLGNAGAAGNYSLPSGSLPGFAGVAGQTYYWRIRIATASPLQSYWTDLQTFTVQQLQAIVPVLGSPINGSEIGSTIPAFSWGPIAGVTTYRFQLATDSEFDDIVYTVVSTSSGAQVPSADALTPGTQYFWRVKALTPAEGEWSTVANFIVAEPVTPPVTPTVTTTATVITTPTLTVINPTSTAKTEIQPAYIWAIIIIGAVLVIAVIVLIVRTRRTV
jgi:trimeric autotransporter adhesin